MTETTQAKTVAETQQITVPPGMVNGGGILGIAVTAVLTFLALRKRWSRDNLELTKDRAETNLIAAYQKTIADLQAANERLDQNAREAWRTRAEDAKRIGELSAKVEHLTEVNQSQTSKVEHLTQINEKLEVQVEELTAMVRRLLAGQQANQQLTTEGNQ